MYYGNNPATENSNSVQRVKNIAYRRSCIGNRISKRHSFRVPSRARLFEDVARTREIRLIRLLIRSCYRNYPGPRSERADHGLVYRAKKEMWRRSEGVASGGTFRSGGESKEKGRGRDG